MVSFMAGWMLRDECFASALAIAWAAPRTGAAARQLYPEDGQRQGGFEPAAMRSARLADSGEVGDRFAMPEKRMGRISTRLTVAHAVVVAAATLVAAPSYPLKPSANGRHLVDQQ